MAGEAVAPGKFELIDTLPLGSEVVAMIECKDSIFVACRDCIYVLTDGVLRPIQFCVPAPQ
jgi:hypothetical protein